MDSVFVSSVQVGYEDVRAAARRAIEAMHMRVLMAEGVGARATSPHRALLDLVAEADIFLLILGKHYSRPTEDEFDEANRLGKPIFVLKEDCEPEPEQAAFIERVAGGWIGGRMWGTFDPNGVLTATVDALSSMRAKEQHAQLVPAARERTQSLARGPDRGGFVGFGSTARIALVPIVATSILDAISINEELGEFVADLARRDRLVPHAVGITPKISRSGVSLVRADVTSGEGPIVTVGIDGAIAYEFDVGGQGSLAGTRLDPSLLSGGIQRVGRFALGIWERLDRREEIQQFMALLAIPNAERRVYDLAADATSYSLATRLPATVIVPEEAVAVRRADAASDRLAESLVAELRAVFVDAGAIGQ